MDFFGSEKYFNNRTPNSVHKLEYELESRTPSDWFMSPNNKKYLNYRIIKEKLNIDEISLTSSMAIWAKKNKINKLYNAEYNTTRNNDYMVILDSMNSSFMSYLKEKFKLFDTLSNTQYIRQYREQSSMVIQDGILQKTGYDEEDLLEKKKLSHMTADDFRNMDVYDPTYDRDLYTQTIGLAMKRSRRNNMQKYMHNRHTDFDVDGLRVKENDRASLDNMVRGFDMSEFRKYADNSKRPISRYQFNT